MSQKPFKVAFEKGERTYGFVNGVNKFQPRENSFNYASCYPIIDYKSASITSTCDFC